TGQRAGDRVARDGALTQDAHPILLSAVDDRRGAARGRHRRIDDEVDSVAELPAHLRRRVALRLAGYVRRRPGDRPELRGGLAKKWIARHTQGDRVAACGRARLERRLLLE